MAGLKKAVLVSEVGWRGIRELSLSLLKNGLSVNIIIKGNVDREVLEIITKPKGLNIYAVPRGFFKIYLFTYLLWQKMFSRLEEIIVSKEQTMMGLKKLGLNVRLLIETDKGYELR